MPTKARSFGRRKYDGAVPLLILAGFLVGLLFTIANACMLYQNAVYMQRFVRVIKVFDAINNNKGPGS